MAFRSWPACTKICSTKRRDRTGAWLRARARAVTAKLYSQGRMEQMAEIAMFVAAGEHLGCATTGPSIARAHGEKELPC